MTDTPDNGLLPVTLMVEEIGFCIGCNKPLLVGQVITAWDDEAGHYDCHDPYSLKRQPDLDADPDTPPPVVLLGNPALHIPLDRISTQAPNDAVEFLPRMMDEWCEAVAESWGQGSETHNVARDGVAIVVAAFKKGPAQ